jgi:hypothetical protein
VRGAAFELPFSFGDALSRKRCCHSLRAPAGPSQAGERELAPAEDATAGTPLTAIEGIHARPRNSPIAGAARVG